MKKVISKRKISICLNDNVMNFLKDFENKSKYVEYLIYKDMNNNELLKKDIIL